MAADPREFVIPPHPDVHVMRTTDDPKAYREAFNDLRWTIENEVIWVRRYHRNVGYERIADFIVDRLGLPYLGASLIGQVIEQMDSLGPERSPAKARQIRHRGRAARLGSDMSTRP